MVKIGIYSWFEIVATLRSFFLGLCPLMCGKAVPFRDSTFDFFEAAPLFGI